MKNKPGADTEEVSTKQEDEIQKKKHQEETRRTRSK